MIGRRGVLAGALAAATCGLFRGDLRAEGPRPGRPPRRLVLVMTPNGTQQASFWPRMDFTSPILAPILDVPSLARRTNVVRGVSVPPGLNGASGNEHDVGFARMFSGAPIVALGGAPWAGAASIDHVLGERWGSEPLNVAVLSSAIEPFPKPGFQHRTSFSYVAPGVLRVPYVDPHAAFVATFGAETSGAFDEAARRQLQTRARVVALQRQQVEALQARLGTVERAKLDLHRHAAGELEKRLTRLGAGAAVACAARPPLPRSWTRDAPALLATDESAIPELSAAMTDLIAAAFACNVTRIATLQLGYAGAKWMFGWEGIDRDVHQDLAHRDRSDEGNDPEVTALLVRAHRWYASQVAALARKLDAVPEGDGTVLDNTLIVWTSDLGRGDHDLDNVPLVLIGGAGAGLAGGRFLDLGPQPFQRVGCSILHAMGEEAAGFGDAPACGPLPALFT